MPPVNGNKGLSSNRDVAPSWHSPSARCDTPHLKAFLISPVKVLLDARRYKINAVYLLTPLINTTQLKSVVSGCRPCPRADEASMSAPAGTTSTSRTREIAIDELLGALCRVATHCAAGREHGREWRMVAMKAATDNAGNV